MNGAALTDDGATRLTASVRHRREEHVEELRPGSSGGSEVRVLFVFDPDRRAVLLVGGDKAGNWHGWYTKSIPVAERRYDEWLRGERDE